MPEIPDSLPISFGIRQCPKPDAPPKPADSLALYEKREFPPAETIVEEPAIAIAARAAVPPAPTSISALARALRNDVDLIYEWVYTCVDYWCMWGSHKGPQAVLIDRNAGCFEQAALMVALLRESGYTANFVYGTIRLSKAQIEQLLGTTETESSHPSEDLLYLAQIPNDAVYDETGLLAYVDMSHVWVQVYLNGIPYVFDPTYKTYSYTEGVDLDSIVDFDESTLMSAALSGASSNTFYVQNLNRPNIVDAFKGSVAKIGKKTVAEV